MAKQSKAIARWESLVAAEMRRSGSTRQKSILVAKREHPAAWQAMIFASNRGHDPDRTEEFLLGRADDDAKKGCA